MRLHAKLAVALGLAAGAALAVVSPAQAKKNCHYVKGNGWGLTQDISKANAKTAYDGSLASYGGKAKGAPYYECKLDFPLQACVAEQLACKKK
jgi:hypothetical protein